MYWKIRCPGCGRPIDHQTVHIRTGLGPRAVICSKCGTKVSSARYEWSEFSGGKKFFYWLLTVPYVLLTAALGGGLGLIVQLNLQVWQEEPLWPPEWPSLPIVALTGLSALIALLIQLYRVFTSRRRPPGQTEATVTSSFWNLQVNLQQKIPAAFVTLWILAAAPLIFKIVSTYFVAK